MPEFKDEEAFQRAVVIMLRRMAPAPGVVWFHVPNGGWRDMATAVKLKAMGVKPGVADLLFFGPQLTPLALELKWGAGRLSPFQKSFKTAWEGMGYSFVVAHDLNDVRDALKEEGFFRGGG